MSLPPPKDNYAGEPQYPAPWTTGQPKEGLRDTGEARIICLAPDVCLTPVGNSVVPIPYQIVDYCGDDQGYTPSVRFTGKKAMVLRSSTTCVHGDAPGTRKGVKSPEVRKWMLDPNNYRFEWGPWNSARGATPPSRYLPPTK
jgi:hypothetical protein